MNIASENNLLYFCYGEVPHRYETLFSMLTLRRFAESDLGRTTIRIMTDQPDFFHPYGFEVLPLSASTIEEWKGPANFHHRCKIMALRHVMTQLPGKWILVDGDTHFIRPPSHVFARLGPSRGVMHRTEGRLCDSMHEFNHRLGELLEDRAPGYHPALDLASGRSTMQWNSGVVGLDASDGPILDEVAGLLDYLLARHFAIVLEQISFSIVLAARTRLRAARDAVFHYNVSPGRTEFRARIPKLLAESEKMAPVERAKWLYARRLRPSFSSRMRMLAKDTLNAIGALPVRDRSDCL